MPKKHVTIAYYEKTNEQKKRYISYMRNKIRKENDTVLKSMMELTEKHLKGYHSDFYVHDVSLFRHTKGTPFLWIVREYGTHFIDLFSEKFHDGEEWDAKAHFKAILSNCGKEIKGIYLIENGKMQKLSEQAALETLAIKEDAIRKTMGCSFKNKK